MQICSKVPWVVLLQVVVRFAMVCGSSCAPLFHSFVLVLFQSLDISSRFSRTVASCIVATATGLTGVDGLTSVGDRSDPCWSSSKPRCCFHYVFVSFGLEDTLFLGPVLLP